MTGLTWVHKFMKISNNEFRAPFVVQTDNQYYTDLRNRYSDFISNAEYAGADKESLDVIKKYTGTVMEAFWYFCRGQIDFAHKKIENLIKDCMESKLAVDVVGNDKALAGDGILAFFHARIGTPRSYKANEMLHVPYSKRFLTGNYRFSIPGVPSYYLANSSYCCWLELGMPADHELNVSPVLLDGSQKIFNLAVEVRNVSYLNGFEPEKVHAWLKLLILMIATSYRVTQKERSFKSEYIISQSIMLACKNNGFDGLTYFSCQVESQDFAQAAINLVLFAPQNKITDEYSEMCSHIKVRDSFNYFTFRQLKISPDELNFQLRWLRTRRVNNIYDYDRQFYYGRTDFCLFDKFLFQGWKYDQIDFGNALGDNKRGRR